MDKLFHNVNAYSEFSLRAVILSFLWLSAERLGPRFVCVWLRGGKQIAELSESCF